MAKLEKKDGAVEQCPNCNQKIVCRMSKGSDKYPAKLQWQDEDGSAHYNFDFATKTTSCKSSNTEKKNLTISMPKSSGTDTQVLDRMKKESSEITKQYIAKYLGVKETCSECGIDNPAVIGMFFNALVRSES